MHTGNTIAAELAHREREIDRLASDARRLRNLLKNAQTAICKQEAQGWVGGTTCEQVAEALHATRYLRA